MTIGTTSRNTLTDVLQRVDPVRETPVQPAYVDLRPRVVGTAPDDRFVTVDVSHTSWARLAAETLGDARHWWVLADLANVVDPFGALTPGMVIRVPSLDRLLFDILVREVSRGA